MKSILKNVFLETIQQCNSSLDLWLDGFGCLLATLGSGEQQKNMIKLSLIIEVIEQEGLSSTLSPKINFMCLCLSQHWDGEE